MKYLISYDVKYDCAVVKDDKRVAVRFKVLKKRWKNEGGKR